MKIIKTIFLIIISLVCLSHCKNSKNEHSHNTANSYYTCPMHPSVVSYSPGSCPVCNMSLILVNKSESNNKLDGNFISINKNHISLAAIKLDTVIETNIFNTSFLNGIVVQNPENTITISAKTSGRIEKLYANYKGYYVEKGKPVFTLYSEKIIALQKELIELLKVDKNENIYNSSSTLLIEASKNRLFEAGLEIEQIEDIIKTGNIIKYITYLAPQNGYINNLKINENTYVEEGQALFKISLQNTMWVEAKLYNSSDVIFTQTNMFKIVPENNSQLILDGNLIISEPYVIGNNRYSLLKIQINNPNKNLIEGIPVKVYPNNTGKITVSVKKNAIIYGKISKVWKLVNLPTKQNENYTFEQIEILTGLTDDNNVEVISGIKVGDIVVTDGSYLINSEFILKNN